MRNHHALKKVGGFLIGVVLLTPVEEFIIGKVLFPRATYVQLFGFGIIIFFTYELLKHYKVIRGRR